MPRTLRACCLLALFALAACSPKARLADTYAPDFYAIDRQLPDSLTQRSMDFLAFGDTQAGWRAEIKFYRRENWVTWKQVLVPFYQLYLLGNGIVGAINYARKQPDYGGSSRGFMREALAAAAERDSITFLLHLGDFADDGRRAKHWAQFLDEYRDDHPLLRTYPLLPTIGNHEYVNDSTYGRPNYEAVFDYPRFYVVDTPLLALFVIDSNVIIDQHTILDDDVQDALFAEWIAAPDTASVATPASSAPAADTLMRRSWLHEALAEREDRPYKIVAMHHPPISFSWHERDWHKPSHGRNLLEKRQRFLGLLQDYGVQVIFSGHEHLYEHNMLRAREGHFGDQLMHLVISSGGGVPLRREATEAEMAERKAGYEAAGLDVLAVKQASVYHYTRVQVRPDTLHILTYAVDEDTPTEPTLLDRILIPRPRP